MLVLVFFFQKFTSIRLKSIFYNSSLLLRINLMAILCSKHEQRKTNCNLVGLIIMSMK